MMPTRCFLLKTLKSQAVDSFETSEPKSPASLATCAVCCTDPPDVFLYHRFEGNPDKKVFDEIRETDLGMIRDTRRLKIT
jgi:hypothetical protein